MKRSAVFLDRDGTIISNIGYLSDPAKVYLIPGVVQALKKLKKKGFRLVIISNQSGVGRGYFSETDLKSVHTRMLNLLEENEIHIDGSYYCIHAPWEQCGCRKPHSKLLYRAAEELDIDLGNSYMVGDKLCDVITGLNAGCKAVLIDRKNVNFKYNNYKEEPDKIFPNLLSASEWILSINCS